MKISVVAVCRLISASWICLADVPVHEISREKVLSAGSEWQANCEAYKPDPGRMEALKSKVGAKLRVDMFRRRGTAQFLIAQETRNFVPSLSHVNIIAALI